MNTSTTNPVRVTITRETIAVHELVKTLAITLFDYRENPSVTITSLAELDAVPSEDTPRNRAALDKAIDFIKTNEVMADAIKKAYPTIVIE